MEQECFICGGVIGVLYTTQTTGQQISMNICKDCQEDIEDTAYMTIYKKCTVEIAHHIPGHSKCGTPHGHSVDIIVGVRGHMNLDTGMVMDFNFLSMILKKEIVDRFDHKYLNNIIPIPTAEFLAFYIYKKLVSRHLLVETVRVHETKNNYVEYRGEAWNV